MSAGVPDPVLGEDLAPLPAGERRRVLFLDRDGIVNVNHGYVHRREDTDWIPGIFDLCRAAVAAGLGLVVVTNQAGIARGYYSAESFADYTRWMHGCFAREGAGVLATYFCPHHPEGAVAGLAVPCGCRKPAPGMLLRAAHDLQIDLAGSLLLGDSASDVAAAESAGVPVAMLCKDAQVRGLAHLAALFEGGWGTSRGAVYRNARVE